MNDEEIMVCNRPQDDDNHKFPYSAEAERELKVIYRVHARWRCPGCRRWVQASGKGADGCKTAIIRKVCKCGAQADAELSDGEYLVFKEGEKNV